MAHRNPLALASLTTLALAMTVPALPALSQSTSFNVNVVPQNPTPDDAVVLRLSGTWRDGCTPGTAITPAVARSGGTVNVTLNYATLQGACTTALTPFTTDVALGKLPAGTYAADVLLIESLIPARSLGTASFTVAPKAFTTLYVFGANALKRGSSGELGCDGSLSIKSRLTLFNNASTPSVASLSALYGETGEEVIPGPITAYSLAARGGTVVDTSIANSASRVSVWAFEVPGRVALRNTLERFVDCDQGANPSQGRLALPVFSALFPAGSTVVSGDVKAIDENATGACPFSADLLAFRRRVNVTMFNAGTSAATFQVVGRQTTEDGNDEIYRGSFTVNAKSARQANDLALDLTKLCSAAGASNVWFEITADQPFLSYVSTAFEDASPGAMPYEIYPSKTEY